MLDRRSHALSAHFLMGHRLNFEPVSPFKSSLFQETDMHPNAKHRLEILGTLYKARESTINPMYPEWITENTLRDAHGDIQFALGVLQEIGYIKCEGRRYRITGPGVVAFERESAGS